MLCENILSVVVGDIECVQTVLVISEYFTVKYTSGKFSGRLNVIRVLHGKFNGGGENKHFRWQSRWGHDC